MASPAPTSGNKPPKTINYVFIDYENVKADSLDLLDPLRFHVVIFCGEHQKTFPITVSIAQARGLTVETVSIVGRTREALDLHIAFYLGRLVSTTDHTLRYYIHIVSRDKGFDPLIQHLTDRNFLAARVDSVSDLPRVRNAAAKSLADRMPIVVTHLQGMNENRPARIKTLTGTIASLFPADVPPAEIDGLIKALQKKGVLNVKDTKVSYPSR